MISPGRGRATGSLPLAGAVLFGALLLGLNQPAVNRYDRVIAALLASRRRPLLDRIARSYEYPGSVEAVGAAAAFEVVLRWRRGEGVGAIEPLVFTATIPLEYGLKVWRHHPAPARQSAALGRILAVPTANSFPSGHSARLAFVATRWIVQRRTRRSGILVAILVAGAAWSRVYLGEHWPSDVLGGLLLGSTTGLIAARLSAGRTRDRPT